MAPRYAKSVPSVTKMFPNFKGMLRAYGLSGRGIKKRDEFVLSFNIRFCKTCWHWVFARRSLQPKRPYFYGKNMLALGL